MHLSITSISLLIEHEAKYYEFQSCNPWTCTIDAHALWHPFYHPIAVVRCLQHLCHNLCTIDYDPWNLPGNTSSLNSFSPLAACISKHIVVTDSVWLFDHDLHIQPYTRNHHRVWTYGALYCHLRLSNYSKIIRTIGGGKFFHSRTRKRAILYHRAASVIWG